MSVPVRLPCFRSTVRNVSGVAMRFPCLGRHGVYLPANGEVELPGNLYDDANPLRRRKFAQIEQLVAQGKLALVTGPEVHLYDPVLRDTKAIILQNGTLQTAVPCWGAFSSV